VYRGDLPKKAAEVRLNRIEQLTASAVAGVSMHTALASWVAILPETSYEKLVQVGLSDPRESSKRDRFTVAELVEAFVERSHGKRCRRAAA
jgi:hypothetical protein